MQKTMEKEDARLHRAYSSRWKRGHRRAVAETHFDCLAEEARVLARLKAGAKT